MSRIPLLDPRQATGPAKDLLDRTQAQLGRVPNLYRAMAQAPAALEGYLAFRAALGQGQLNPRLREQLALLVAEENACGYCVSAHVFRGTRMGIAPDELQANREGEAQDPKTAAALRFARRGLRARGAVSDLELDGARAAGWSDGEITEIVAHVALNSFSNAFSHLAQPELDFPAVALVSHV
jgi:uncharacterized peroxidase-related enzyme